MWVWLTGATGSVGSNHDIDTGELARREVAA